LPVAIQVEPYIQKGNEGFVHHYVIYECDGNFTENDFDEGVDCFATANMPYRRCQKADLLAAWAVGGEVQPRSQVFSSFPLPRCREREEERHWERHWEKWTSFFKCDHGIYFGAVQSGSYLESVDEILKRNHSNESYCAAIFRSARVPVVLS